MAKNLVVKTNYLNTVLQNLSLVEVRVIQLAIIDARESGRGLSPETPLRISAERYAEAFGTTAQNAYMVLSETSRSLIKRYFSFINPRNNLVISNWVSQIEYFEGAGAIELIFTPAVVQGISRIDGAVEFFTKYLLSNTINFKSVYSVRLYELMAQWKNSDSGKTPIFELETFRGQLGVDKKDYERMYDFKKYVLDRAIGEINEHSDLEINYEQHKKGRVIYGFSFNIKVKGKANTPHEKLLQQRPDDTIDAFAKMTDKQRYWLANRLAKLSELAYLSQPKWDYQDFANAIANDLLDEERQKIYRPHFATVGFQDK